MSDGDWEYVPVRTGSLVDRVRREKQEISRSDVTTRHALRPARHRTEILAHSRCELFFKKLTNRIVNVVRLDIL